MGTVYLAVRADREYQKRVAIKVVRRGMDTDFILRRFRQERQILAGLDHPNIARLIDGGTNEFGLPYFVMDYVDGEPITRYCDRRGLTIPERLALFRSVCSAVHYAHQNLVIHRDLKPGNVLVTPDGVPKLIDFGIAKLLNPELSPETIDLTADLMRLVTPDYASPEQLRGERITTASDVYSLGVLLYELLTGRRPRRLRSRSPESVLRALAEEKPDRPSAAVVRAEPDAELPHTGSTGPLPRDEDADRRRLSRWLKGDLDTIVMRALDEEPHRRYPSVERLSDDVGRHLEGRPVTARKNTLGYRSRRFLARHKAAAAAGALGVVLVVGGVAVTVRQGRIADAERAKAEERLTEIRKLTNSFLFEFHDAIAKLPGSTTARELIVRRALEYLGTLGKAGGDPSVQRELASAYQKVGGVQGLGGSANLGDSAGALASYNAARAILERLVASSIVEPRDRAELASCYLDLSRIHIGRMELTEALADGRRSLALREELARGGGSKPLAWIGAAHKNLGLILHLKGDMTGARVELDRADNAFDRALRADATDFDARRGKASALFETASVLGDLGDIRTALEKAVQSAEIEEALAAEHADDARLRMDLALTLHDVGEYEGNLGHIDRAIARYRSALEIAEKLVQADPKNAQAQIAKAYFAIDLGNQVAKSGRLDEGLRYQRMAARISEDLLATDPANGYARENLARATASAGDVLCPAVFRASYPGLSEADRWREARGWYRKSLEVWSVMRRSGKLRSQHAGEPPRVAAQLAVCDTALARSR